MLDRRGSRPKFDVDSSNPCWLVHSAFFSGVGLVNWIQIIMFITIPCVQKLLLLILVQLLENVFESIHLVLTAFERGSEGFFDVRVTDVFQHFHPSVGAFLEVPLIN